MSGVLVEAAGDQDPADVVVPRWLTWSRTLTLAVVGIAGGLLSYDSLYAKAVDQFGDHLAYAFPVLVDFLILGASLAYIAGAKRGRPRAGWRLTAHCAVAGTIALNALAAPSPAAVPWHITAPIVWSVLVELIARDVLGEFRATHAPTEGIPFALWLTAPGESLATWLRVRRQAAHATARMEVGSHAAATEALHLALPGRRARRVRKILRRQLRAGSRTPEQILDQAIGLLAHHEPGSPLAVLRDVLAATSSVAAPPEPVIVVAELAAADQAPPPAERPALAAPAPEEAPAPTPAPDLAAEPATAPLEPLPTAPEQAPSYVPEPPSRAEIAPAASQTPPPPAPERPAARRAAPAPAPAASSGGAKMQLARSVLIAQGGSVPAAERILHGQVGLRTIQNAARELRAETELTGPETAPELAAQTRPVQRPEPSAPARIAPAPAAETAPDLARNLRSVPRAATDRQEVHA